MANNRDHPGVYVPPPLIYAAIFFLSFLLQRWWPLESSFFLRREAEIGGLVLIAVALIFLLPALIRFARTRNTVVTIRPAQSLQTTGVYGYTRNPMYTGLLFLYAGLALLEGNWWTVVLIPVVILVIQRYVIGSEERYLTRAFGEEYDSYRKRVRRWI